MEDAVTIGVLGTIFTIPHRQAALLAENLRLFAAGSFPNDVVAVTRLGVNPLWAERGARPLADRLEDALVGRTTEPIGLTAGMEAHAMYAALSLITGTQPERSGAMGLRDKLADLLATE